MNKELTADEMFKSLKYKQGNAIQKENDKLQYIAYYNHDTSITFYIDIKMINITNLITMQELQAINKKVEELGWID